LRIPVLYRGERIGRMEISQQGLMTVFEARCRDPGELLRLSVYGEDGTEGYLGVMAPSGGALYLRRGLSRAGLRGFPQRAVYAGPAGQAAAQKTETALVPVPDGKRITAPERERQAAVVQKARPSAEQQMESDDVLWRRSWDGSLTASWQGREFMALPAPEGGLPMFRCLERRVIEGESYMVFELKDGKIV